MVRDLGFPGLVTGVLDADGQVDIPWMKIMAAGDGAAGGDLSSRLICALTRVRPWKTRRGRWG